jgi:outer membrane scaffolding protein for murein synthesis (MipA/OmpV family)
MAVLVGAILLPPAARAHADPAPEWVVDVGGAARVRPAHLGSGRYVADGVPLLEASYGDQLTISLDDGVKWRALRAGQVSAGPVAEYRQAFNDQLPAGTRRMSDAVELGGFTEVRTSLGIAEARIRRAVNAYDGWSADLSFSTGAPVGRRLFLGGQARASWADGRFTDEYFGLRPDVAAAFGLPAPFRRNYVTAGAELEAIGQVTSASRLVVALSADRIVSDLRPSPLFQDRKILTAALGLTYRLRGSQTGHLP